MAPTINRPAPSASRSKNARGPVVPVIPLPIAQKQQQARQLKQQKQEELEKAKEAEKEKKVKEAKQAMEAKQVKQAKQAKEQAKQAKEQAELGQKKKLENRLKIKENGSPTPASNNSSKTEIASPTPKSPSDTPSSPPAATDSTPRTAHGTATTVSSPDAKISQSPLATAPAVTVAAPAAAATAAAAVETSPSETTGRQTPATRHAGYSSTPTHNLHAPLSAGPLTNGNVAPDFVFPVQSRSGSAARHHGPSARHPANAPPQGLHQTHLSNNSITFGFQSSNNPSPAPVGHGPLPPPPGLLAGPPYVPFNAPNMGLGDWAGPPGLAPISDVNGYTPTTAGYNSSNPGSFRGSHSPDHAVDGVAYGHQAGPFPLPGPNGTMPPRNDSMPAMSPHFFHPGFPGGGPLERHGGPVGAPGGGLGGSPVRVVDFQLIQHLQQQVHHSFDNPQTADTHILLHFPKDPSQASRHARSDLRYNEQSKMFAGNRAVLSQSYTIAQFLRNDPGTMHPGPYNQPVFLYHLKIDDPFLTSEAAMQALRSLYGLPIESLSVADGSIGGAMDKALANLAAGFLFMLEHVKAVGAEQVSQLISWETVERVFAFCLNGASFPNLPDNPNPNPYEQPFLRADFRYGDSTSPIIRRLVQAAIDFVVRNFPRDVQLGLDGVVDSALPRFSRFPVQVVQVPTESQAHVSAAQSRNPGGFAVPTGVDAAHSRSNGSVSMPSRFSVGGAKSPQLMFGDFAPREDTGPSLSFPKANGLVAANAASVVALSQILVSLPFGYLKYVLEHPALGSGAANAGKSPQGPISRERRRALVGSVIEERERRRQEALNSIRAGLVIDNAEQRDAVLSRVQGPAPPQHRDHPFAVDAWDALGWKEYSYSDEPKLGRVWAQSDASR